MSGSLLALPAVLGTLRLRLEVIDADAAAVIRQAPHGGPRDPRWHPQFPGAEDVAAAGMTVPADPAGWGPRLVVRSFDDLVVGTAGFFGPPDAGADGILEAELGFGLVPDAHGHGAGREAVRGLIAAAETCAVRVRARVAPENSRSLRLLAVCGFTELRGSDEDGLLVMARPWAGPDV